MKYRFITLRMIVLAAGALLAAPSAAASKCDTDVVPAATLLVPYFEVDLERPEARTTLFSVTNTSAEPALANVVLWTDRAVPTLSFEVYLAGLDVQSFNLKDVLVDGRLPVTGRAVSPHGLLSAPPVEFPGCNNGTTPGAAPVYGSPALGAQELARIQAYHTGACFEGQYAGSTADLEAELTTARGYITVDVVERCSGMTPADQGYFGGVGSGVASDRNVLTGDFFLVRDQENFAQGEQAVHIEAFPGTFAAGDHTFYRRYVAGSAADNREPLGTQYSVRHLKGGAFDGGTKFFVWRDTGSADAGPWACTELPSWYGSDGMESFTVLVSEEGATIRSRETGNECSILPPCRGIRKFPVATQAVPFTIPYFDLASETAFGTTYINLRRASTEDPSEWPVLQGWVFATNSAEGRFSVGQHATRLDSACNPGPSLFVPEDFPE